jgi:bifunctional UDP-N-acetylglucosamine pyrophosphorylase/glucosamine-1-phosphate N-acetyltransferase
MSVSVIVLAAGQGTRMRSGSAKVLEEAAGRTLLAWVLAALGGIGAEDLSIVVGHDADAVRRHCPDGASVVEQIPQNGTGHAAAIGISGLASRTGTVLVVPGDMPLIRTESLERLIDLHHEVDAAATVLSVDLDEPTGYGRIIRSNGDVTAIVEEKDATDEQRRVTEVNTSVYAFDLELLADALARVRNDNAQGEYYLTDVIGLLAAGDHTVAALRVDAEQGIGVNTHRDLATAAAVLRGRINDALLESGVWMLDPQRVYVDASATVEPGVKLYPETYLRGSSSVATGAEIGPNVQLTNTSVGRGAKVQQAVAISAEIGDRALVGPFAYLRPGAVLREGAKVGTFVEVKASDIGEGSKVPHLSYIGDTTIGASSNVGAGTVTVNYDGFVKNRTIIGNNVRIGSDTMLVAPVTVGDDAFTGAGSVITKDVPPGALAIERSAQKNVEGYATKRQQRAEGDEG